MSAKVTVVAPSNIAFVKYWGARDLPSAIPYCPSISMSLTRCVTRCTVEHRESGGEDEVLFRFPDGRLRPPGEGFTRRVRQHLERLRQSAGRSGSFHVATENSFPSAAGLASSASGFAALALGATRALGLDPSPGELSSLARLSGSGSAARSAFGGFVQWPARDDDGSCGAEALAGHEHWDLCDVIALVDTEAKATSSVEGHRRATTSPHFTTRRELLPGRLAEVRAAIDGCDMKALGRVIEEDAIELHVIAMTSKPPIFYWKPGTLLALDAVRELRGDGVPAFATMDAGANVHVICPPAAEDDVATRLSSIDLVVSVIRDRVGPGPRQTTEHLA